MIGHLVHRVSVSISVVCLVLFGCGGGDSSNSDGSSMLDLNGDRAGSSANNQGGISATGSAAGTNANGNNQTSGGSSGQGESAINAMCPRKVPNDFVCNPYCNTGCQRGEHCTLANNTFACVPTGAGTLGAPCRSSSDCGQKMACFQLRGEDLSTCRQFCTSDIECPQERKCELRVNFGAGEHSFCTDISVSCDPFTENGSVGGMPASGGMSAVAGRPADGGENGTAGMPSGAGTEGSAGAASSGGASSGGMSIAGRMAAGVMTEGGEIAGGGQSTSGGDVAGHSMAGDLAGTTTGGQAAGAVAGQPGAGHSAADMAGDPVGGRPAINAMCETAFDGQFGLCEAVLGWGMNPDGVCRIVSGCGCGELCESRVFPTKADCEIGCFGRVEGAPFCDTVNAEEFGLCNQFLGFGVDESGSCVGVSGCGCGERCAGRVFDSIEDCQRVCLYNRALQVTGGMDGSAGGANAGDAAGLAIVGGAASADDGGSSAPTGGLQVSIDTQVAAAMCEDGQGCYLSRDATKCLSAGTLAKGEACEAPNDCAPGLHCLVECRDVCSVRAGHPQSCAQVCPEPPAEVIMAIGRPDVVKFTTVSEENELGVCLGTEIPGCDIFGNDCLANEGCYPVRGGNACIPAGTKTPGTPCDASNECQPGNLCIFDVCLPYCRDSVDTPEDKRCANRCPGETTPLLPVIWQGGVCTNVMASNPCNFWAEGADCMEAGDVCVPTPVGEICQAASGMGGLGDQCSSTTDCQKGLVCPSQVNQCKQACSIEPFVDGGFMPPICMDNCAGGPGMPIAPDSRIGYCP